MLPMSDAHADFAAQFNAQLQRARLRALATIEELTAPSPAAAEAPADLAERRLAHQERALRLRAAAAILREKPIDDPVDDDAGADVDAPAHRSNLPRSWRNKPVPPRPHPFENIQGWRSHPLDGDAMAQPRPTGARPDANAAIHTASAAERQPTAT